VARILGPAQVVGEASLQPNDVSDASRPGGSKAERFVVYSLPDLNTIEKRPAKRASRKAEEALPIVQLGSGIDPAKWESDALVIVYYGADSKAIGVRTDMSIKTALAALSDVTSATVLAASGVTPKAAISMSSSAVSPDASDTASAPFDSFWGSGFVADETLGYQLQIGGLANFLTPRVRVAETPGADLGDVTLVLAPDLVGPDDTVVANATGSVTTSASSDTLNSEVPLGDRHGPSSYSDRTMWVIVASRPYGTEEAAQQRADALNGADKKGHFSVERSGHLDGLGTSDFFVVIYDVTYLWEDAAKRAVSANASKLPMSEVNIVQVVKKCGDLTISRMEQ
jgi:hypothetical protein